MPVINNFELSKQERSYVSVMNWLGYEFVDKDENTNALIFNMRGHHSRDDDSVIRISFKDWMEISEFLDGPRECFFPYDNSEPSEFKPLYMNSKDYAITFDELDYYTESEKENIACLKQLQNVLNQNFDGLHIYKEALSELVDAPDGFGEARVKWVLANIVEANYDAYSKDVQQWADRQFDNVDISKKHFLRTEIPTVADRSLFNKRSDKKDRYGEYYINISYGGQEDLKRIFQHNMPVYFKELYPHKNFLSFDLIDYKPGDNRFPAEFANFGSHNPYKAFQGIEQDYSDNIAEIQQNGSLHPSVIEGFIKMAIPVLDHHIVEQTAVLTDENGKERYESDQRPSAGYKWLSPCTVSKAVFEYAMKKLYSPSEKTMGEEVDTLVNIDSSIASLRHRMEVEKSKMEEFYQHVTPDDLGKSQTVLAQYEGNINLYQDIINGLENQKHDIRHVHHVNDPEGISVDCVRLFGVRTCEGLYDQNSPVQAAIVCHADTPERLAAFQKEMNELSVKINGMPIEITVTDDLDKLLQEDKANLDNAVQNQEFKAGTPVAYWNRNTKAPKPEVYADQAPDKTTKMSERLKTSLNGAENHNQNRNTIKIDSKLKENSL